MQRRVADLDPGVVTAKRRESAKPPQRNLASSILQILAGILLGFALIYISERYRLSFSALLLPALFVGYLFSIFIHEAGHLLIALFVNFRVLSFAVWPAQLNFDQSAWRWSWLARKGPKGFIAITPIGTERLRSRLFFVTAAGPVASALLVVVCWFVLAQMDLPRWAAEQILLISLCSLVFAVAGLIPIRTQTVISDGARLAMLLRGSADWERMSAQQMTVAAAVSGIRPRDWNPDLIEMGLGPEDGTLEARTGRALRYSYLIDQGRIDEAEQELVWLLHEPCPDAAVTTWQLQVVWFAAAFQGDPATARKWFDQPTPHKANPCERLMAEAALAFVEQRRSDSTRLTAEAIRACEQITDRGSAQAIHEKLLALENSLRTAPKVN